jgi:phosphoribosylformylglycinamidine synthase II
VGQDKRVNEDLAAKLKHYRLNEAEHKRIAGLLGREPQGVEWALFSAMWSEHCSYKSSRIHLKGLFNKSPRVLESFGENAGVVDLGDGERVAFKIESHNHPSFIEPYQGAATGVGGILRDIFTMGARPIAIADYLCFGRPRAERMEKIVDGVVRGIGGYGNPVGVATITGQTEFDESYDKNVLVNAMAVGLFRNGEKVFLSKAKGVGNLVVYAGAKTGRDGVHGASMASESFGKDSEKKRPTIQIGDPFFEKLLIEACLEVMDQDLVVAIQDMGAAGLTSSSFEMASKGAVGFNLHLDRVPLREATLEPEDILLSESQERMLMVVEPGKLSKVEAVFKRWGLEAVAVGDVTQKKTMKLFWKGDLLTEIDPELLTEHAPLYERPFEKWSPKNRIASVKELDLSAASSATASISSLASAPVLASAKDRLLAALSSPQGCSREFIYRQYDGHVGAATAADCHEAVGVIRLKDSGRGLGVVLGCRPQLMRLDAREGGLDAVAYPSLELASKGFEPLAVTDCLNFGNPELVPVMSSFVAALSGMNEICAALVAPIISGNVSFYNETEGRGITPTPSTGIVGLRPSVDGLAKGHFAREGDSVYLLRLPLLCQNGAMAELEKVEPRAVGSLEGNSIAKFALSLRLLADCADGSKDSISASRMVGKFGLAYALARMVMPKGLGIKIEEATLNLARPELACLPIATSLFTEVCYEVVIVSRESEAVIRERWVKHGGAASALSRLGAVVGSNLTLGDAVDISAVILKQKYEGGWTEAFEHLSTLGTK